MTGTNEVYVPGVFGDIFDVVFAYPDVGKWRTIDTYAVVIAAGEIELTDPEGRRLARYVQRGGTLLVADAHLTGPGAAALGLPPAGPQAEADGYRWLADPSICPSQRFRYKPIELAVRRGRTLAQSPDGKTFCAAFDRGKGRLVYLSVPYGLGIDGQALPVLARLIAHLTRGLMPVDVDGDVEWLVNRSRSGWVVTLLNPAGQAKPQHGITPTDFRESRSIAIRSRVPVRSARDWLVPDEGLAVQDSTIHCEVPAGGVRIIELR